MKIKIFFITLICFSTFLKCQTSSNYTLFHSEPQQGIPEKQEFYTGKALPDEPVYHYKSLPSYDSLGDSISNRINNSGNNFTDTRGATVEEISRLAEREPSTMSIGSPFNSISKSEIEKNTQQDETKTYIIILSLCVVVLLFLLINNTQKIKISIKSMVGLFSLTAFITHIWTAIIGFTYAGFWGGLLTLFLPFLGELYWMIKMFSVNDLYAYIALIHLILSIPITLLRN